MLFGWSDGLAVDFGALGKVNLGGGAVAVLWFLHICSRGWWLLQSPLLGMFLCGWAVMVVFCVSAGVEKWLWLQDCRVLKPFVAPLTVFFWSGDLATRKLIGMGELKDSLYYFRALSVTAASANVVQDTSFELWHQ
ncbi:hypothetical protein Pint_34314 [Pistacia integerrima]|uniref:Uncharacterized protein n=1 Tax=Pistacia integerrima TaxID=434235 RepID=A0ACC0X8Z1_9ROSI|nr:hypothetical protein Pint_34314 [Pistacia integerrima]